MERYGIVLAQGGEAVFPKMIMSCTILCKLTAHHPEHPNKVLSSRLQSVEDVGGNDTDAEGEKN